MACIYKRGRYWQIKYRDPDRSRWVQKSLLTTDRAEAEAELARVRAVECSLLRRRVPNPEAAHFIALYTDRAGPTIQGKRLQAQVCSITRLFAFAQADRVGDITPARVRAWRTALVRAGKSPRAINEAVLAVRNVFDRAARAGLWSRPNPAGGIEALAVPAPVVEYLSPKERDALIEQAESVGRMTLWAVMLGCFAGLRHMELVGADWSRIDWTTTGPSIDVGSRRVPMHHLLFDSMFRHRQGAGPVFAPAPAPGQASAAPYDLTAGVVTAMKRAGLPTHAPFTRLRDTFGANLAIAGVPMHKIARWLGVSVTSADRRYGGLIRYDRDIDRI